MLQVSFDLPFLKISIPGLQHDHVALAVIQVISDGISDLHSSVEALELAPATATRVLAAWSLCQDALRGQLNRTFGLPLAILAEVSLNSLVEAFDSRYAALRHADVARRIKSDLPGSCLATLADIVLSRGVEESHTTSSHDDVAVDPEAGLPGPYPATLAAGCSWNRFVTRRSRSTSATESPLFKVTR